MGCIFIVVFLEGSHRPGVGGWLSLNLSEPKGHLTVLPLEDEVGVKVIPHIISFGNNCISMKKNLQLKKIFSLVMLSPKDFIHLIFFVCWDLTYNG